MLVLHLYEAVFLFYIIEMNSSDFGKHSKSKHPKSPSFRKFKPLWYEYYPRFSNICRNSAHLNQFLVFYGCLSNLKHFLSIDNLLENANVSHREAIKPGNFYDETKIEKSAKITKQAYAFENSAHISNVEIWILLIQNFDSKILNLLSKINKKICWMNSEGLHLLWLWFSNLEKQ